MKTMLVALGAASLLLSACGTPESECRDGVKQMRSKMVGIIGSGEHKEAADPMVQASTQLDMAQTALSAGNFDTCVDNLKEARALLNRSQRTNQE